MARPDPYILFAQSFVHSHLDEYTDEIIFAEPVVITACEFIELNASSASSSVSLSGATSPPSFALEVFVRYEEEHRFRRLCQPFLYSPSSSNVLEIEALMTSHLVIRGSYRSLTLVIYGNTAEDFGQVNIDLDLDGSLANLVPLSTDNDVENLLPVLQREKLSFEESLSVPQSFSLPVFKLDFSQELNFLHLILKSCKLPNLGNSIHKVVSVTASAISSYIFSDLCGAAISHVPSKQDVLNSCQKEKADFFANSRNVLVELCHMHHGSAEGDTELREDGSLQPDSMVANTKIRADVFSYCLFLSKCSPTYGLTSLSQSESMVLQLSMLFLVCCGRDGCLHFVNGGGMRQLERFFDVGNSHAVTLMLLGVTERATRYAVGCEGFLGWWPRGDGNVPNGTSLGYSFLIKLLLMKQWHDVVSLATFLLQRLRLYEIVSRYECAVISALGKLSSLCTDGVVNCFESANSHLKTLVRLLSLRGPVEDASLLFISSGSVLCPPVEGLLSYKATVNLIPASKSCFLNADIDVNLLLLLKERGFLPLCAALLSSPILQSENGLPMEILFDMVASAEAIILSLLSCRAGLLFLLHQPEVSKAIVLALKAFNNLDVVDCAPLRYASMLVARGFICRTLDIGVLMELHLCVVSAIDRLLSVPPHSDEFLWILWELSALSRSDAGSHALLVLGHFPEAILVLIEALCSVREFHLGPPNSAGISALGLAIFYSAAEIIKILVMDSTASSLGSWIKHAVDLHKALHSSSLGSNRKDAPTRLLERVDAGVVYQKHGPIGLLKYAAILASGGDAHLSSSSILVSDMIDVENVVGDSCEGTDIQVIENLLGRLVSDRYFDGVALRDSSISQLATAFSILAFISENNAVAVALYEENVVILVYVVLVSCKFMLEQSSSTYGYLIDEGDEGNSMSNLLFDSSCYQSLIDLMIPSLTLLLGIFRQLQEAKEQHRNTKLLNVLLQLHREVSIKLAACAVDLSSPYPGSALGLGAVCRLLVSTLAYWPVFGWKPYLFTRLLENLEITRQIALGPKDACSLFWLLGDLFPEEDVWLWKNGMPALTALRTLAVGTVIGPQKEKDIGWYLQPEYVTTILNRLSPLLDKFAQIVLRFSFTAVAVVQDMIRVFIVRIACHKDEWALVLLRPILSWMCDHILPSTNLSDVDVFKVQKALHFCAGLFEYPTTKVLLLREGILEMLRQALGYCCIVFTTDEKLVFKDRISNGFEVLNWFLPLCKCLVLITDCHPLQLSGAEKQSARYLSFDDYSLVGCLLFKMCQALPVGNELLASLEVFKKIASLEQGKSAFASILQTVPSSLVSTELQAKESMRYCGDDESYWQKYPPLLNCVKNILLSFSAGDDISFHAVHAIQELCLSAFCLCEDGGSLEGIFVTKQLFGLPPDFHEGMDCAGERLKDICELLAILVRASEHARFSHKNLQLFMVKDSLESLLLMLKKSPASFEENVLNKGFISYEDLFPPKNVAPYILPCLSSRIHDDEARFLSKDALVDGFNETTGSWLSLGLEDKFIWECPDTLDRLDTLNIPARRRLVVLEGPNRYIKGDNVGVENVGLNALSRGWTAGYVAASGPTRRDNFRQRKPNTSRPPSMHVDDYVARERNVDGSASGSSILSSIQRGGSAGGRPPSIHVDEFIARQRERQNVVSSPVTQATSDVNRAAAVDENVSDKADRSQQLKADIDDDLHEINIVFDEETEADDITPFPQPDDSLDMAPVVMDENSPLPVMDEGDGDLSTSLRTPQQGRPSPSNISNDARMELPLYMAASQEKLHMRKEPGSNVAQNHPPTSAGSPNQADGKHNTPAVSMNLPPFTSQVYIKGPALSIGHDNSLTAQAISSQKEIPEQAFGFPVISETQGFYNEKAFISQPPLPPLPPFPAVSLLSSRTSVDLVHGQLLCGQPPFTSSFPIQTPDTSKLSNGLMFPSLFSDSFSQPFPSLFSTDYPPACSTSNPSGSVMTPRPVDAKHVWFSPSSKLHEEIAVSSVRPPPPLPPTPPPFTAQSSTSLSSMYSQTNNVIQLPFPLIPLCDTQLGTHTLSSLILPSLISPSMLARPAPVSGAPLGGIAVQKQLSQAPLPSFPSPGRLSAQLMQPRPPPQPPLLPRAPHPPQYPRPVDASISLQQTSNNLQFQTSHVLPQPQLPCQSQSQLVDQHFHSQQHQETNVAQMPQGDSGFQQDSGLNLQQYFSSPDAIQSLLSDREKLCQLLEQYPKLMQMLQEKLGQL